MRTMSLEEARRRTMAARPKPTQTLTPKPAPKPETAPKPEPPIVNVTTPAPIVNMDTTAIAEVVKQVLDQKPEPITQPKPTEWTFTVNRDDRGLIKTITATAKQGTD